MLFPVLLVGVSSIFLYLILAVIRGFMVMRALDIEDSKDETIQKLWNEYLESTAEQNRESFDFGNWYFTTHVLPSLNKDLQVNSNIDIMKNINVHTRQYYLQGFFNDMDAHRLSNWKTKLNENLMAGKRPELQSQWQEELAVLESVEKLKNSVN